jgi:nicotinamide-nucleotide amidase
VDDLTLEVAAETFGSTMVKDVAATKNVTSLIRRHRRKLNEGHKKMMFIPMGSKALWNQEGTAPAVRWDVGDRTYFFLPGVPREFHFCFEEHVMPFLKRMAPQEGDYLFILKVLGWPESILDQMVKKISWPKEAEIGFRTTLPENHIKILVRASSRSAAMKKIQKPVSQLEKKLGRSLFTSEASESFGDVFLREMLKAKQTLSVAESCTGGLISAVVTAVAGSSAVFDRGFVVYSNEAKQELLGVRQKTLRQHGAVSEECIHELLDGVLSRTEATCAIAVSGIAGPSGGTKSKPVGTIWIGAAVKNKRKTKLLQLSFSRELNQRFSAFAALQLLRELI